MLEFEHQAKLFKNIVSVTSEIEILEEISIDQLLSSMKNQIEINNGDLEWYKNGRLHREEGPAIERADRSKEWWIDGNRHH
jgi:hypothetical protein